MFLDREPLRRLVFSKRRNRIENGERKRQRARESFVCLFVSVGEKESYIRVGLAGAECGYGKVLRSERRTRRTSAECHSIALPNEDRRFMLRIFTVKSGRLFS